LTGVAIAPAPTPCLLPYRHILQTLPMFPPVFTAGGCSVVSALVALFGTITGKTPKFRVDGGCVAENLALQNIQVGACFNRLFSCTDSRIVLGLPLIFI
jgi:hypothetical protein